MNLQFNGTHFKVTNAVRFINEVLSKDENFWKEIEEKDKFEGSSRSPLEIARDMRAYQWTAMVVFYRRRFGSVNAKVVPSAPRTIQVNSRRLGRSQASVVNTLVHEFVHVVDFSGDGDRRIQNGHPKNKKRDETAPWWIGKLAQKYFILLNPGLVSDDAEDDASGQCGTCDQNDEVSQAFD